MFMVYLFGLRCKGRAILVSCFMHARTPPLSSFPCPSPSGTASVCRMSHSPCGELLMTLISGQKAHVTNALRRCSQAKQAQPPPPSTFLSPALLHPLHMQHCNPRMENQQISPYATRQQLQIGSPNCSACLLQLPTYSTSPACPPPCRYSPLIGN